MVYDDQAYGQEKVYKNTQWRQNDTFELIKRDEDMFVIQYVTTFPDNIPQIKK